MSNATPHAPDLERIVLGVCLLSPSTISRVKERLTPRHFYLEENVIIWRSILSMQEKGVKVDLMTLAHELKRIDRLDDVGGVYYLSQLTGGVSSADNVHDHARILEEHYMRREVIRFASESLKSAYDETVDVFDVLSATQVGIAGLTASVNAGAPPRSMAEIHVDIVDNHAKPRLLKLGLGPLDECVSLQPGDMVVIGARPSVGKTVSALVVARSIAEQGQKVGIISLEMSGTQLTARVSSSISGVDSNRITINELNDSERGRMGIAGNNNGVWMHRILVDDRSTFHRSDIFAVFAMFKRLGVEAIIIDYIQLMDGDKGTPYEVMTSISKTIKQAGKKELICPIVLSQLKRRPGAEENPELSDLRDSGQIEADGDIIILLGRKKGERQVKVDLAKHKFGDVGFWYLYFDLSHQRFGDVVPQTPGSPTGMLAAAGQRELPEDEDTPF